MTEPGWETVRRVVTSRSGVLLDEVAAKVRKHHLYEGVSAIDLWRSRPGLDPDLDVDGVQLDPRLPDGGSQMYIVTLVPGIVVPMHSTETIDHHCVVSGEIVCVLEDGEVTVGAGEVLVMRGTPHGWENRGTVPWVSVVTSVSARPAG